MLLSQRTFDSSYPGVTQDTQPKANTDNAEINRFSLLRQSADTAGTVVTSACLRSQAGTAKNTLCFILHIRPALLPLATIGPPEMALKLLTGQFINARLYCQTVSKNLKGL
jgi:hypothetical protein